MSEVIKSRNDLETVTPMMQQYLDVKAGYEDYILMYRLGDFFECFYEDAVTASRVLELTLTGRDCGNGKRAAMCGVPFHKADLYIGKLVERGYKVAVCEQTEDPSAAQGLVRREVVRVVTPGTVTDGSLLADKKNNYLAALAVGKEGVGVAFADVSTGQVFVTRLYGEDVEGRLLNELSAYAPREVLLNASGSSIERVDRYIKESLGAMVTERREGLFEESSATRLVRECFGEAIGSLDGVLCVSAVGALLAYIRETQMCAPSFIRELNAYADGQFMELDHSTRRNLELTENMRTKEKKGTLLWVLDETKTAMGARLLRSWLLKPLRSAFAIANRQTAVTELYKDYMLRENLRAALSGILDLERLTAKAVYGTANAKDLRAIAESLVVLPTVKEQLSLSPTERLAKLGREMDALEDIYTLLDTAIVENPPFTVREGGMIREGYSSDVDYLRSIEGSGEAWMRDIEEREREESGIKTLRVGYNKVFGYYIEVTKSLVSQVPARYIRKQTLTNCERYITEELKNMEATVLGAKDKLCALEFSLFNDVREKLVALSARVQATAALIAELDVYASLAEVAVANRYTCPEIDSSGDIEIRDGRHPVVERFSEGCFVPNDTFLDTKKQRLMLITGPNMAGKSTYMRQVALIAIMAQIGSYVPAVGVRMGVIDKVFTRVGASDDLASGQSTFMLEMTEVAHILKNATSRSLIIYDEVGRGTSTYDGMSIARAVAEYTLGKRIGAKTLFATHYHELTVMEEELEGVVNYNIAAKKRAEGITFLRRIVRGATDDSYGIDVAKLAGVPSEVVKRAKEILAAVEGGESIPAPSRSVAPRKEEGRAEEDLFAAIVADEEAEVAEKLRRLDLNTVTPIEALNLIYELKKILTANKD